MDHAEVNFALGKHKWWKTAALQMRIQLYTLVLCTSGGYDGGLWMNQGDARNFSSRKTKVTWKRGTVGGKYVCKKFRRQRRPSSRRCLQSWKDGTMMSQKLIDLSVWLREEETEMGDLSWG